MNVAQASDPSLPRHKLDVHDYHRMAEAGILSTRDRVELIEGEIIDMPAIGGAHVNLVTWLTRPARIGARGTCVDLGPEPAAADRSDGTGARSRSAASEAGSAAFEGGSAGRRRPARRRGRRLVAGLRPRHEVPALRGERRARGVARRRERADPRALPRPPTRTRAATRDVDEPDRARPVVDRRVVRHSRSTCPSLF